MKNVDLNTSRPQGLDSYREGKDELNLAEFPLTAISDRCPDGMKTVVISDQVWDRQQRQHLPRKLTISGSDRYGLPVAKDEDVLLACVQLSSIASFHSRRLEFTRYELLKILRWAQDSANYKRLATSLRRWKGTSIFSDRAFYDHGRKSWVNRDFGIFDNLFIYERENGNDISTRSWLLWNEVIFDSFQAGYLKTLDWDLYCRLESPLAKRLYRFLDKRFYHGAEVTIDLHDLAFRKLRLSPSYNTAQIKRVLLPGIAELETLWELRSRKPERRFRKLSRGSWEAVFVKRKPRQGRREHQSQQQSELDAQSLAIELSKRGVGPSAAADLVADHPENRISTMIALYDWHNSRGQERGAGFLVAGIRSKEPYRLPKGFRSPHQTARNFRNRSVREKPKQEDHAKEKDQNSELAPFMAFWEKLDANARAEFEQHAFARTDPIKRRWYEDACASGRDTASFFRLAILNDHFRQEESEKSASGSSQSKACQKIDDGALCTNEH